MSVTSTEKHLIARGWKKLTPGQAKRLAKHDDRVALKVVGSLLYELYTLNGSTYIRRL